VAAGEINFFLDNEPVRLGPGDMFTVPANVPHAVQLLSEYVRLIDSFTPIREEFLK
jgi:quercetin dioxygenase-like cupin family protein